MVSSFNTNALSESLDNIDDGQSPFCAPPVISSLHAGGGFDSGGDDEDGNVDITLTPPPPCHDDQVWACADIVLLT